MRVHRPGIADVLRRFGADYCATHSLSVPQQRAWRAIVSCRTAALGGHLERCDHCGALRHVYHSCRNRHCPQCQTRAKEAWRLARMRELLPVPYFHLVFTLPHALNAVIARHSRALYELLFGAVRDTLLAFSADTRWLGGTPSFSLVLHTWQQDLSRHVHVHALMAGGALTAQGQWCAPKRGYLFPVQALSAVFRGKFMTALRQLRTHGSVHDDAQLSATWWHTLEREAYRHDWVVYAKQPMGGPAQTLDYLARYTHRVAISNDRLLTLNDDGVRFKARDSLHPKKRRIVQLSGEQFIARFLLHILPRGFKRIRHYGLLAPARKRVALMAARTALQAPTPEPVVIEAVADFMRRVTGQELMCCPHCQHGHFCRIAVLLPCPRVTPMARAPPPITEQARCA